MTLTEAETATGIARPEPVVTPVAQRVDALPAGTFVRCPACEVVLYGRRLADHAAVCPECGHHFPLGARKRVGALVDSGSFAELDADLSSEDPLEFADRIAYTDRLLALRRRTGSAEAAIYGTATIGGEAVVIGALDFAFLGGSMGCVVGEKVARAAELARERGCCLILLASSGGARMQEGIFSLLQMAKTAAALQRLEVSGTPFISVLVDPVYGGVAASFASLGNVILAEPGARAGFAGPRIISETIGGSLPAGFQTAEFLLEEGQIDAIIPRTELRHALGRLVRCYTAAAPPQTPARVRAPARRSALGPPLSPEAAWATVKAAREPERPNLEDYLLGAFDDFFELRGDRWSDDDPSLRGGIALLGGRRAVVLGHHKGRGTKDAIKRNFGMPHPSGYRKAARLMRHAENLDCPLVTLIDTPGAYPGVRAEEQNQSGAIAHNLALLSGLRTPVVSLVVGEGGSGGALALGIADRLLMLEHTIFSVISPEGAAALLFRDAKHAPEAAAKLRITAPELEALGVVDRIVAEPAGGAHLDRPGTVAIVRAALVQELERLTAVPLDALLRERTRRLSSYGTAWSPTAAVDAA